MMSPSCKDPWCRTNRRGLAGDESAGTGTVQIWKAVCRLDGPDAQGSFDCWQSQARYHYEAGDEALRKTLVVGATSLLRQVRAGRGRNASLWLIELLKRKAPKLAAVALANKIARIAWKMMVTGEAYKGNAARPALACAA
ncbi:hypothetical protein ABIA10_007520 [Rhizobium leguminosarum]|jgi:hypothetical protein|uniref:Transposase n=1 Tax=Rhizobium leguminosarum bv. trifolii TaxID=386 RepID=A0A1C9HZI0_RHILT|nr:transposase [Rhizobium leguminosarum bv. trifolii]